MTAIVMRSRTVSRIDGSSGWEWRIVTDPLGYVDRDIRLVTRAEALGFIREHELVEALDNHDGTVWDSPDKSFLDRYRGLFSSTDKRVRRKLERLWG